MKVDKNKTLVLLCNARAYTTFIEFTGEDKAYQAILLVSFFIKFITIIITSVIPVIPAGVWPVVVS